MVRRERSAGAGTSCWVIALSAIVVSAFGSQLVAHTVLMDCVQHRVALTVGRTDIEVDLELIFGEWQSLLQRRQMDRDGDETISAEERAAYERYLAGTSTEHLSLFVDDRRLDVIPLYDPAVDLGGSSKTSLIGHRVRISYFARTPSWLAPGSRITVADGLWAKQPGLDFLNVIGEDGFRLVIENTDAATQRQAAGGPRLMQARCTMAAGCAGPLAIVAAVDGGTATPSSRTEPPTAFYRPTDAKGGDSAGTAFLLIATAALGVLVILKPPSLCRQGELR